MLGGGYFLREQDSDFRIGVLQQFLGNLQPVQLLLFALQLFCFFGWANVLYLGLGVDCG